MPRMNPERQVGGNSRRRRSPLKALHVTQSLTGKQHSRRGAVPGIAAAWMAGIGWCGSGGGPARYVPCRARSPRDVGGGPTGLRKESVHWSPRARRGERGLGLDRNSRLRHLTQIFRFFARTRRLKPKIAIHIAKSCMPGRPWRRAGRKPAGGRIACNVGPSPGFISGCYPGHKKTVLEAVAGRAHVALRPICEGCNRRE